jgi:ATP-dependent RNA helicase DeaD
MTFKDFNFKPKLQDAINYAGFVEPSPIQQSAIPIVLDGKDIVAQAQTGTGKTAAFGLPIIQNINPQDGVGAVVIVPTRELAMQVSDEIFRFGKNLGIKTVTVYGGSSYSRQIRFIETASVIVATPGRFLDLLSKGQIDISPKYVVLDEADEMLDMGFLDDIKKIFTYMPSNRQTLMFSATMPQEIKNLAKKILNEPEFITATKTEMTNENIEQNYYVVDEYERDDALIRLMDYKNPVKSIIFCRVKKEVDRLATLLVSQGFLAKGLHGDMEQRQREEVIRSFKSSAIEVLVATDVAARGLDVSDVSHVFNYHIPFDNESYVHRIGRTGRAGKLGVAVSLVTPHEIKAIDRIQKHTKSKIKTKIIPTITDVQSKKQSGLIGKIKAKKIDNSAYEIIEQLKEDFDISTIAFKLASLLSDSQKVKGADNIGKSIGEIKRLIEKSKYSNSGNGRNRRRGGNRSHRSGGGGYRGGNGGRNRSRSGGGNRSGGDRH